MRYPFLAEIAGFELARRNIYRPTAFRVRTLQPLGYVSNYTLIIADDRHSVIYYIKQLFCRGYRKIYTSMGSAVLVYITAE